MHFNYNNHKNENKSNSLLKKRVSIKIHTPIEKRHCGESQEVKGKQVIENPNYPLPMTNYA